MGESEMAWMMDSEAKLAALSLAEMSALVEWVEVELVQVVQVEMSACTHLQRPQLF